MKILVIDNYDSFVYNLVHILRTFEHVEEITIKRNDKLTLAEVAQYDKILLSPGPGIPEEAGIMMDVIREYAPTKSILGVCLGHQAIGEVFGGRLENMSEVLHGLATPTKLQENAEPLFAGLPTEIQVGRYHSWCIHPSSINEQLKITAVDDKGTIMGIRHQEYDVCGVQFHPESVLTEHGIKMIANWVNN